MRQNCDTWKQTASNEAYKENIIIQSKLISPVILSLCPAGGRTHKHEYTFSKRQSERDPDSNPRVSYLTVDRSKYPCIPKLQLHS